LLTKALITHAADRHWGLYRNTRFRMGELLRREERSREALATYLEVLYLDRNGPNNVGGVRVEWDLPAIPEWSPSQALMAPGIVERVQRLVKDLGVSAEDLHTLFHQVAERAYRDLRLPLSPTDAWQTIRPQLFPDRGT
jgi:hypothetical protein